MKCLPRAQRQDLCLIGSVQQHLSLSFQPEKAEHIIIDPGIT